MEQSKITVTKVDQPQGGKSRQFLYAALVALIIVQVFSFFQSERATPDQEALSLTTNKSSYSITKPVLATLRNTTSTDITVAYECPNLPFQLVQSAGTNYVNVTPAYEIDCSNPQLSGSVTVAAGEQETFNFSPWQRAYFSEIGSYKLVYSTSGSLDSSQSIAPETEDLELEADIILTPETTEIVSPEFTITPRGFFSNLWYQSLFRPFYNALVWLITVLPGGSLGVAIILLTLAIRLVLFYPSHKALSSQKQMQVVQPKLQELRKKYKDDQQKLAQETMKLWKEHKVNPMGNCLPLLIQFPILLAMFHVVSTGISPASADALYTTFANFDFSLIHTNFLGVLDLTTRNFIWLPFVVGGLQFLQMHLTLSGKEQTTDAAPGLGANQKIMTYGLPAMIAVFTASVPAGVGLYWGTSTLFAILQQIVINKSNGKNPTTPKVIEAEEV